MLSAHMDEVGLLVRRITEDGYVMIPSRWAGGSTRR